MKRTFAVAAVVVLGTASAFALAQAPERLERRVAELEQTLARLEKRVAELEAKLAGSERRGMMGGGGMMGRGGTMGGRGGMMEDRKPNEQWRSPEAGR